MSDLEFSIPNFMELNEEYGKLQAENERLREGLRSILDAQIDFTLKEYERDLLIKHIAEKALEERG